MTLALLATTACTKASTFTCADSTDCKDGSFTGTCQDNGYCSFDDDACPSGQRYGDLAGGELAGECVELEGTTGPSATTSEDGPVTLEGGLEQASLEASSLDDTTTIDPSDETTSTGNAVDDTSTSGRTTMPDLDSGPAEESSTGTNACDDIEVDDECSACAYDVCCDQLLDCQFDMACICYVQCVASMAPLDLCTERCGSSMALDALNACLAFQCMGCVPMP